MSCPFQTFGVGAGRTWKTSLPGYSAPWMLTRGAPLFTLISFGIEVNESKPCDVEERENSWFTRSRITE